MGKILVEFRAHEDYFVDTDTYLIYTARHNSKTQWTQGVAPLSAAISTVGAFAVKNTLSQTSILINIYLICYILIITGILGYIGYYLAIRSLKRAKKISVFTLVSLTEDEKNNLRNRVSKMYRNAYLIFFIAFVCTAIFAYWFINFSNNQILFILILTLVIDVLSLSLLGQFHLQNKILKEIVRRKI